jgi:hypothetical protein
MPRNISRIPLGDEIEVTVRGRTMDELKSLALDEAAAYFGVDREIATLIVLGSLGKPVLVDESGRTLMYKATVKVRWSPEDPE